MSDVDSMKLNKLKGVYLGDLLSVKNRRYMVAGNYPKDGYILLSEMGNSRTSAIKMDYEEVARSVVFKS